MATRDVHLEQFDRLTGLLARASRETSAVIRQASRALLAADPDAAGAVLAGQPARDELHREIDEVIPVLLARQQPVASDLRLVIGAVRMNADMLRMSALACHIARIAQSRYPACAVPPTALAVITAMADVAARLADKSSVVLGTRDPIDAMQMSLDDDEMDALETQLFILLAEDWPHGVEAAVDLAMLGRFYERIADHAVSVARRVAYLVQGTPIAGP
ncbi:MAG TPA: PhoU domain-containing protein [Micromonosporaceae bacterium]|nr:PhoU domain-containing protein [Micromonosporaceae bacterium]